MIFPDDVFSEYILECGGEQRRKLAGSTDRYALGRVFAEYGLRRIRKSRGKQYKIRSQLCKVTNDHEAKHGLDVK